MGVFIKDLEMPKDCCDCPCHDGEYGTCNLLKRTTFDLPPKDCPIQEYKISEKEEQKEGLSDKMSKYIDVNDVNTLLEALIEARQDAFTPKAYVAGLKRAKNVISALPTVDAQEVKHGKWAHLGGDEWCCSECGFVITTEGSWDKPTEKYCTECGAKMDLQEEEK